MKVSPKNSYGRVETISDKLADKTWMKTRTLFAQCPKMTRKENTVKKSGVPQNVPSSYEHVERNFKAPPKKIDKARKVLSQLPILIKKLIFLKRYVFPHNAHVDT